MLNYKLILLMSINLEKSNNLMKKNKSPIEEVILIYPNQIVKGVITHHSFHKKLAATEDSKLILTLCNLGLILIRSKMRF